MKQKIEEIRSRDAACLTYSDGTIHCDDAGDYVAEDRRFLLQALAGMENALNLISDGNADDECATPLTKEDMMRIARSALSAGENDGA